MFLQICMFDSQVFSGQNESQFNHSLNSSIIDESPRKSTKQKGNEFLNTAGYFRLPSCQLGKNISWKWSEGSESLCDCSNTNPVISGTIEVLIPRVGRRKNPAAGMLNFLYYWPLAFSLSLTHSRLPIYLSSFNINTILLCTLNINTHFGEIYKKEKALNNDTGSRAAHSLSSKTGEKLKLVNVLIYRCAWYQLTDFVVCTLVVMQDVKCSDAWQWSRLCNWMRFLFHTSFQAQRQEKKQHFSHPLICFKASDCDFYIDSDLNKFPLFFFVWLSDELLVTNTKQ